MKRRTRGREGGEREGLMETERGWGEERAKVREGAREREKKKTK